MFGLTVGYSDLSPKFDSDVLEYEATTANTVDLIRTETGNSSIEVTLRVDGIANPITPLDPNAITITTQPENYVGDVGDTATFTVEAEGNSLTYQWEAWSVTRQMYIQTSMTGNKTNTLSVPITAARYGALYRCVLTDGNYNVIESQPAMIVATGNATDESTSANDATTVITRFRVEWPNINNSASITVKNGRLTTTYTIDVEKS